MIITLPSINLQLAKNCDGYTLSSQVGSNKSVIEKNKNKIISIELILCKKDQKQKGLIIKKILGTKNANLRCLDFGSSTESYLSHDHDTKTTKEHESINYEMVSLDDSTVKHL